LHSATFPQ